MKSIKPLISILCVTLMCFAARAAQAAVALERVAVEVIEVEQELSKEELSVQKRLERMQNKMKKKGMDVDFSDPIQKWLWFAIMGWVAGILLVAVALLLLLFGSAAVVTTGVGVVGALIIAGRVLMFLGTVSLIIWGVKVFSY